MKTDSIDVIGATIVRLSDGVIISEPGMFVIEDVNGEYVLAESTPTDSTSCLHSCLFYRDHQVFSTCSLAGYRNWGCATTFGKVDLE